MTQMQSPYQEQQQATLYQEPERTSIMAILSMIFGIGGCCLGLTSIPAILLGIFGLVGISRSKGRVGGSGFGIAGILIGLLTLALWGGLVFGGGSILNSMMSKFGDSTERMFLALQSDSFDTARGEMNSPAGDEPDEMLIAFRESYQGTLGDFVSKPDSLGELWSGYGAVISLFQPYQNQQGYIPLPMRFDSGWALVVYVIDVQSNSPGFPMPIEYIVIDQQGNEYRLPGVGSLLAQPETSLPDPDAGEADESAADEPTADDEGP